MTFHARGDEGRVPNAAVMVEADAAAAAIGWLQEVLL